MSKIYSFNLDRDLVALFDQNIGMNRSAAMRAALAKVHKEPGLVAEALYLRLRYRMRPGEKQRITVTWTDDAHAMLDDVAEAVHLPKESILALAMLNYIASSLFLKKEGSNEVDRDLHDDGARRPERGRDSPSPQHERPKPAFQAYKVGPPSTVATINSGQDQGGQDQSS